MFFTDLSGQILAGMGLQLSVFTAFFRKFAYNGYSSELNPLNQENT
jgi:hypothetical protein